MTSAIIWCARDEHDDMQELRKKLTELLPFPTETTKVNTFIHTTIARYKKNLRNPAAVLDILEQQTQTVSMPVTEIILRQENRYPSLGTVELARIHLIL